MSEESARVWETMFKMKQDDWNDACKAVDQLKDENQALRKIVDDLMKALKESGTDISNAYVWTSAYSKGFVDQSVKRTNDALASAKSELEKLKPTGGEG